MRRRFRRRTYVNYHRGNAPGMAHNDAVHARDEARTGRIVRGVVAATGCGGIIARVHRRKADLSRAMTVANRAAVKDYRTAIRKILDHRGLVNARGTLKQPYLHLAVHGMRDRPRYGLEIGTRDGTLSHPQVRRWLVREVRESAGTLGCRVTVDRDHRGTQALLRLRTSRKRKPRNKGYGPNYNAVQIEIGQTLRQELSGLIALFAGIVSAFQVRF